jgi:hypothetical protein
MRRDGCVVTTAPGGIEEILLLIARGGEIDIMPSRRSPVFKPLLLQA